MNNTQNYVLRKHKLFDNWNFDIEQEELIYSDCAPTHHGLQCNFVGGTPEHTEIMGLCDQLVIIIKKIDAINTRIIGVDENICDDYWETVPVRWVKWTKRQPAWNGSVYLQFNGKNQGIGHVNSGQLLKLEGHATKYHIENDKCVADYTEEQLEMLDTVYWLEQLNDEVEFVEFTDKYGYKLKNKMFPIRIKADEEELKWYFLNHYFSDKVSKKDKDLWYRTNELAQAFVKIFKNI